MLRDGESRRMGNRKRGTGEKQGDQLVFSSSVLPISTLLPVKGTGGMIERDRQTGPPNPPGTCRSPSARETFVVAETVRPRNGHRAHRVSQLSDMTRRVVDIARNGPKRSLRPRPDSADSGPRISRRGKATSELPRTAACVSRKSLLLPKIEGCDSRGWKVERQL